MRCNNYVQNDSSCIIYRLAVVLWVRFQLLERKWHPGARFRLFPRDDFLLSQKKERFAAELLFALAPRYVLRVRAAPEMNSR
jgi:hypothetical protein